MSDLLRGAACLARGFHLLGRPRIRSFAVVPLVLTLLVYLLLFWFLAGYFSEIVDAARDHLPMWLQGLEWVLWGIFLVAGLGIVLLTFVLLAGVVACPFNGPLAEAVEAHLTGLSREGNPWPRVLARLPLTVAQELKKVLYALLLTLPCLLLFLIPGVNAFAPFVWMVVSAWISAFEFLDYPLDNAGLTLREMRGLLRRRRLLVLGFGAAVTALLVVPLLGVLTVPAAVCGATVLWVEHLRAELSPGSAPR